MSTGRVPSSIGGHEHKKAKKKGEQEQQASGGGAAGLSASNPEGPNQYTGEEAKANQSVGTTLAREASDRAHDASQRAEGSTDFSLHREATERHNDAAEAHQEAQPHYKPGSTMNSFHKHMARMHTELANKHADLAEKYDLNSRNRAGKRGLQAADHVDSEGGGDDGWRKTTVVQHSNLAIDASNDLSKAAHEASADAHDQNTPEAHEAAAAAHSAAAKAYKETGEGDDDAHRRAHEDYAACHRQFASVLKNAPSPAEASAAKRLGALQATKKARETMNKAMKAANALSEKTPEKPLADSENPAKLTIEADKASKVAKSLTTTADTLGTQESHQKAADAHSVAYDAHMAAYGAHASSGSHDTILDKHMLAMADHANDRQGHVDAASDATGSGQSGTQARGGGRRGLSANNSNDVSNQGDADADLGFDEADPHTKEANRLTKKANAKSATAAAGGTPEQHWEAAAANHLAANAHSKIASGELDGEGGFTGTVKNAHQQLANNHIDTAKMHAKAAAAMDPKDYAATDPSQAKFRATPDGYGEAQASSMGGSGALNASAALALECYGAGNTMRSQVTEEGTLMYMPGGVFTITPSQDGRPVTVTVAVDSSSAEAMEEQRQALTAKGKKPFFSIQHATETAGFWPTKFYWDTRVDATGKSRAGVWCDGTWTKSGKEARDGRDFRTFSPTFFVDEVKNDPSNPARVVCNIEARANMGALENDPAFTSMSPLWARGKGGASGNLAIKAAYQALRDAGHDLTLEEFAQTLNQTGTTATVDEVAAALATD